MFNEKDNKVICPCCEQERRIKHDTRLTQLEGALLSKGLPWWGEPGWMIKAAEGKTLQWACKNCLNEKRAIPANPEAQTFVDFAPYFAYFDVSLQCSDCGKEFIFSSKEQLFWYEHLKFWVQSRPKQCVECRRIRREQKRQQAEK